MMFVTLTLTGNPNQLYNTITYPCPETYYEGCNSSATTTMTPQSVTMTTLLVRCCV